MVLILVFIHIHLRIRWCTRFDFILHSIRCFLYNLCKYLYGVSGLSHLTQGPWTVSGCSNILSAPYITTIFHSGFYYMQSLMYPYHSHLAQAVVKSRFVNPWQPNLHCRPKFELHCPPIGSWQSVCQTLSSIKGFL